MQKIRHITRKLEDLMAAKVIAFANHKGGVGKTASTVNVAYCLAKRKRRVLVVDCDPQGNASLTLGTVSPYEQPRTVANLFTGLSFSAAAVPSKYEGLDLIPANLNVYATVSTLSNSIKRFFGFRQALDKAALNTYDYILLDCPPTIEGALLTNALIITDYIITNRNNSFPKQLNHIVYKRIVIIDNEHFFHEYKNNK